MKLDNKVDQAIWKQLLNSYKSKIPKALCTAVVDF